LGNAGIDNGLFQIFALKCDIHAALALRNNCKPSGINSKVRPPNNVNIPIDNQAVANGRNLVCG
jgi:hypothetical protein